jgi:hypothetical protein
VSTLIELPAWLLVLVALGGYCWGAFMTFAAWISRRREGDGDE